MAFDVNIKQTDSYWIYDIQASTEEEAIEKADKMMKEYGKGEFYDDGELKTVAYRQKESS